MGVPMLFETLGSRDDSVFVEGLMNLSTAKDTSWLWDLDSLGSFAATVREGSFLVHLLMQCMLVSGSWH